MDFVANQSAILLLETLGTVSKPATQPTLHEAKWSLNEIQMIFLLTHLTLCTEMKAAGVRH